MSFYGLVLAVFVLAAVFYLFYFVGELSYINEIRLACLSAAYALHLYLQVPIAVLQAICF